MRTTTVLFAVFTFLFALVGAFPSRGLNARRLARGLGPLPPVRRSPTPVALAPRQEPSSAPQCGSGNLQCCNSATSSTDPVVGLLAGVLGLVLPGITETVGLGCTPISLLGLGGDGCTSQTLCCENNEFSGIISLGCVPISISL